GDLDVSAATLVSSFSFLCLSGPNTYFLSSGHFPTDTCTLSLHDALPIYGSPGSTFDNAGTFTALSDAKFGNGGYGAGVIFNNSRTEEQTSELQSHLNIVYRLQL